MRVTHVIGVYREGLGYEENHLCFEQASLGAEVSLITSALAQGTWQGLSHGPPAPETETPGVYTRSGVTIHRLEHRLSVRKNSQVVLKGLRSALKRMQPDIVHVHGPVGALSVQSMLACRAMGLPSVVDNHLCYFNLQPYYAAKRAYYQTFRRIVLPYFASSVGTYVPLMPDSAAVFHNELGIPYERMTQSTLGADTETFNFRPSARKRIREGFGIPGDAPVITFVGRITPTKQVEELVSAWFRLALLHDAYLLLVGPATQEMRESLIAPIAPPLRSMLKLTGYVSNPDLPDYFSAADIAVWPGDPGISTFQGMSCGLAIVCAEADYLPKAYGNYEIFPRGDVGALTSTLASMLTDRDKLDSMKNESRRFAEEVFDWKVVASRTNAIYDRLIHARA